MQSLLNVPAEVVSANINAAVAKAAAKKRRIFPSGTYDDRVCRRRTVYRGLYDVHGMYERPYWLWKPFKDPFDRLSGEFCRSGADRLSGGSQRPV